MNEDAVAALVQQIQSEVKTFLTSLVAESERSVVVLGGARLDTALEKALKRVLRPHPGGNDNLFDPDRPLGTFAAKIALSYRLGLIDEGFEHALQMVRRIRNGFAHSIESDSLLRPQNKSRVDEILRVVRNDPNLGITEPPFAIASENSSLRDFAIAVTMMIMKLEVIALFNEPTKPGHAATFL